MKIVLAPTPMFYVYFDFEGVEEKWAVTAETKMFSDRGQFQKELDDLESKGVTHVYLYEMYYDVWKSGETVWFVRYCYLHPGLVYGLTTQPQRLYTRGTN